MTRPATSTLGWGVSLRFHGLGVRECSVRDGLPLRLGEDPTCTLVVPGLGDAVPLSLGDRLQHVPGLTGVVHRGGQAEPFGPTTPEAALAPGDHAELRLVDHPEITLELRRQTFERLPLATLVNLRELGRQCILGAGLIAGLVLLIRNETPVNVLEVKGDPDAPADSLLVRAMFAATFEPPPPIDVRLLPLPPPAPEVAPALPIAAVAVTPLPLAEAPEEFVAPTEAAVDARPARRKKRRAEPEPVEMFAMLSAMDPGEDRGLIGAQQDGEQVWGELGVAEGGVVGGVAPDVLRALEPDAPALVGEAVAAKIDVPTIEPEVVPDSVDFVVDLWGGGAAKPVPSDIPTLTPPGAAEPVPSNIPTLTISGTDSHSQTGAPVVHGAPDGAAAIAPGSKCDDPTLVEKRQLDIVFAVDVSTTMAFMLDRIERQVVQVDAEARAQGLDARFGLVVFVDDVQLGNQGQPYAELGALQADLARWRAFTASNRELGSEATNLDWPENTLDAVHLAATGFAWRPADTTLRMIVHATDDDFGEAPAIQSGQPIQHTYVETVAALRAAEVRLFSFAAKVGGQCECLDVRAGLFTRHHGRPSLPDATGGAVFDIDEVARGKLGFVAAIAGAIKSGVCTRYPLSPFGDAPVRPRPSTVPAPQ